MAGTYEETGPERSAESRYCGPVSAVEIRPARAGDAGAVAAIWTAGWLDGHLGHVPAALVTARSAGSFQARAAERVADTTVAVTGGEVAGFVMVVADEVEQVYVSGEHRGAGVATLLIAEAERLVAAGGHQEAWLNVVPGNARARRFYERSGWADAGPVELTITHDGEAIAVPCHRYVKPV
jgi:ribosomal protein S18 acetylase RimI-like enzyme